MSEEACEAEAAAWVLPNFVAPSMTPILQLTDTDCAAPFKSACRAAKEELLHLLKKKAREEKTGETFTVRLSDLLAVVQSGLARLKKLNSENDLVLAGKKEQVPAEGP